MTTRPASVADADDIARVVNAAYQVERFFVEGNRTSSAKVRELMRDSRFLVAESDDGRLLGCVNVTTGGERSSFGMLAVEPGSQGHGIGRALIAAAETLARQAGCRVMDIQVVNLRADLLRYYPQLGYQPAGVAPYDHRPVLRECHFVKMSRPL